MDISGNSVKPSLYGGVLRDYGAKLGSDRYCLLAKRRIEEEPVDDRLYLPAGCLIRIK